MGEEEFQLKHFDAPSYLFNTVGPQYGILFIGVSGTGATWHAHGETWAGNAYGRKRWFLYPPEVSPPGGFWPGYSAKDWFTNIYPHLDGDLSKINDTNDWNNHFVYDDEHEFSTNDPNGFGNRHFLRNSVWNRTTSDTQSKSLNSDSSVYDILSSDHLYKHSGLHRPIECIQKERQLIYLPEFWWHAV